VTDNVPDDAEALGRALTALGIVCTVEVRGRLAILVGDAAEDVHPFGEPAERERALRAAAAHGFTHVAVELRAVPRATGEARAEDRRAALSRA